LKYSRDAESQADLMGAQILHDSGYDPNGMVQFFEKIQAESKGRAVQFFSDHPNPENRISNVQAEIQRLGGPLPNAHTDSPDFHTVKTAMTSAPAPRKGATGNARSTDNRNGNGGRPTAPSGRMTTYNGPDIQFQYPDNWRQYGQGSAMTLAPDGGVVNGGLAYGLMISAFEPDYHGQGQQSLEDATDQLLNDLQRTNPNMRITRSHERIRVGGRQGYMTEASNASPAGSRETDWVISTMAPNGQIYYFVAVAPQNDFNNYSRTFEEIIDSVKFR